MGDQPVSLSVLEIDIGCGDDIDTRGEERIGFVSAAICSDRVNGCLEEKGETENEREQWKEGGERERERGARGREGRESYSWLLEKWKGKKNNKKSKNKNFKREYQNCETQNCEDNKHESENAKETQKHNGI
jgi:hypothetical protein